MKFTFFNNKAQGTIEYLVIISIVVVIGLIVVSLLISQVDASSDVTSTSGEISSKIGVGGLSLGDSVAGVDENGLLVIKNIDVENLTLSKIIIDGVDHNFYEQIVAGDEKSFKLQDVASCVGEKKSYSVKVEFVSASGLSKVADFGNISLDCTSVVTPVGVAVEETIADSPYDLIITGDGIYYASYPIAGNYVNIGNNEGYPTYAREDDMFFIYYISGTETYVLDTSLENSYSPEGFHLTNADPNGFGVYIPNWDESPTTTGSGTASPA